MPRGNLMVPDGSHQRNSKGPTHGQRKMIRRCHRQKPGQALVVNRISPDPDQRAVKAMIKSWRHRKPLGAFLSEAGAQWSEDARAHAHTHLHRRAPLLKSDLAHVVQQLPHQQQYARVAQGQGTGVQGRAQLPELPVRPRPQPREGHELRFGQPLGPLVLRTDGAGAARQGRVRAVLRQRPLQPPPVRPRKSLCEMFDDGDRVGPRPKRIEIPSAALRLIEREASALRQCNTEGAAISKKKSGRQVPKKTRLDTFARYCLDIADVPVKHVPPPTPQGSFSGGGTRPSPPPVALSSRGVQGAEANFWSRLISAKVARETF